MASQGPEWPVNLSERGGLEAAGPAGSVSSHGPTAPQDLPRLRPSPAARCPDASLSHGGTSTSGLRPPAAHGRQLSGLPSWEALWPGRPAARGHGPHCHLPLPVLGPCSLPPGPVSFRSTETLGCTSSSAPSTPLCRPAPPQPPGPTCPSGSLLGALSICPGRGSACGSACGTGCGAGCCCHSPSGGSPRSSDDGPRCGEGAQVRSWGGVGFQRQVGSEGGRWESPPALTCPASIFLSVKQAPGVGRAHSLPGVGAPPCLRGAEEWPGAALLPPHRSPPFQAPQSLRPSGHLSLESALSLPSRVWLPPQSHPDFPYPAPPTEAGTLGILAPRAVRAVWGWRGGPAPRRWGLCGCRTQVPSPSVRECSPSSRPGAQSQREKPSLPSPGAPGPLRPAAPLPSAGFSCLGALLLLAGLGSVLPSTRPSSGCCRAPPLRPRRWSRPQCSGSTWIGPERIPQFP